MKWLKWLETAVGILSLLVLAFSFFHKSPVTTVIPLSSEQGPTGRIELSIPRQVYAGDKAILIARVELEEEGANPAQPVITGWLESGIEAVEPEGRVQIILQSGIPVELRWILRTMRPVDYSANLWLWWGKDSSEQLLLVHEFSLRSEDFLGLRVHTVRLICLGVFLVMGILFFLPVRKKMNPNINSPK